MQVPLLSGDYKKNDNQVRKGDVILRYCPPEHCSAQMEKLVTLHQQHLAKSVPPEVSAAWLHHRLVQIHPFQDGNGRVARSLASLVFLKAELFPVTVSRDQVAAYIESLEAADRGDLSSLVRFFVDVQLQRFNQALNLSSDIQEQRSTVGLAVKSIGETLRKKQEQHAAKLRSVLQTAHLLAEGAERRLEAVSREITAEGLGADTSRSNESNDYFYRGQAIGFARIHDYYADTHTYRSWVKIRFETDPATQLLLHFHCRGREFIGVAVCAAIFEMIESAQDGGPALRESIDIVLDPFEFYGTETEQQANDRFSIWLDQTLAIALAQVQRFL